MQDVKQIDTTIEIITPENISFRYRAAGPFRRLPAFLIDLAIRATTVFVIAITTAMFGVVLQGLSVALFLVAVFLLTWFYGAFFETVMNGQTPGKRMTGLRVLTVDGRPIDGMQAVLRNLLRSLEVDIFPVPTFIIGGVVAALNPRFQRLGDIAAGTIVVVEERKWLFGVSKLDDPRAAQLAAYIPANFVFTRTIRRALATYVERRRFFSAIRRREIARYLAEPMIDRLQLPSDTSYDLMLCAMYHMAFLGREGGDDEPLRTASPTANSTSNATTSVPT